MTNDLISPIRVNSLPEVIVDRLRKAIITNVLKPGERLTELALSAQLGVSRSPIREALQTLKANGLVIEENNRGCIVWTPTVSDVDEIFSLRTMVEILASEWFLQHITEEDIHNLELMIVEQRQALESNDVYSMIESDKCFHQYICNHSNHNRLKELWNQIMWQWEVLISLRVRKNPNIILPTVAQDHTAIVEALISRDLERISELHRVINIRVAANVKEVIEQEPGQ